MPIITSSWQFSLFLSLLGYLCLVRLLRHRRAQGLKARYAPAGRESFRHMTGDDAQAILKTLAELEFPKIYGFSMVVAQFRVR